MKIELQQSEVNTVINALKLLRSHQNFAAKALSGIVNEGQVRYGIKLVESLQEKFEKALESDGPKRRNV